MFSLNDYQFDWGPAYTGSSPGSMYTNLVSFTSDEAATNMGQAYLKPVGVLNNGNCYSACDLFSALMQDSEAATIFSHDGKSGGGGANGLYS